ncbi:MAG: ribosomal-protein-alanine N-acetyltransferase [Thermoprotei archaeon]|nr:MAG: ribosomal-protein-alanine N-acetyltransferase [Thermoprotei archaeon]
MLRIRRAKPSDMEKVAVLEEKCFRYPYPRTLLHMLCALYPELFLVAELGNEVVGYVSAVVKRGDVGHIVSICVDPQYRRRGVGKRLMQEVERVLVELFGVKSIRLEVRVSNIPAINLYKSLGYRIVDKLRNYYPDGEDAYVMYKNVKE